MADWRDRTQPAAYAGAEWLAGLLHRRGLPDMSPFGRRVADLVGQVWMGIYHLPEASLKRATWSDDRYVEISLPLSLDTYDGNLLTVLVVLCHDAGMRLEVNPHSFRYLRLAFTQRHQREGGRMWDRMPTLERHVEMIRAHLGDGAPKFPGEVATDA